MTGVFLLYYPYMVLWLGLWAAACASIAGMGLAAVAIFNWKQFNEPASRFLLGAFFIVLGNGAAISFLAFTKYMLAARL